MLTGIILPWVLAWLVADAAGNWFTKWWAQAYSGVQPGAYLWAVCILVGIGTYAVAGAVGLLVTFLVDERIASNSGRAGN